jgi:outer membrane protein OmpA-like peptidoglycan-associated protein/tetratricopeptide (TPR) repeat protein
MVKDISKVIFFCVTLIFFQTSFAQSNKETATQFLETAEEIMRETRAIDDAKDLFIQAADLDPENIRANWMAGDVLLKTTNKERSVKYLERVLTLDPDYRFDILYYIGEGYQYGFEFQNAIDAYEKYKAKLLADPNYRGRDKVPLRNVERRIYECQNALEFIVNPKNYSIVNLGNQINSPYDDFAPVFNEDESLVIFTTRRREGNTSEDVDNDNKPFEDVFYSRKVSGVWSQATNIGEEINTPFHDSNLALSADGKILFVYKDENGGDIYYSDIEDEATGVWSPPKPLSDNINSSFGEPSISISPDEQLLFYSSDRPGGIGGLDLYVSYKDEKGRWGRSVNLGPMINTEEDDDSPFIDYDGKTLYFSSKGRKGMGQFDIFRSEFDSVEMDWKEPVNLGYPINTPDDDIYFVSTKDGERGYYASVREDGLGYLDIYMVTVPDLLASNVPQSETEKEPEQDKEPDDGVIDKPDTEAALLPVTLMVRVRDAQSRQTVDARVKLTNSDTRVELLPQKKETGVYEFKVLNQSASNFMLSAEKNGYAFKNQRVSLPASTAEAQEVRKTLDLSQMQVGVRGILRNIYFDFDKADLKEVSYNELNKLERMLASNPSYTVEISGHTDNIGSKSVNKRLSQRRAQVVVDYLVGKGIDASRLKAVGYGEERPLASNDDEKEGRELNRRVEFKVLGTK